MIPATTSSTPPAESSPQEASTSCLYFLSGTFTSPSPFFTSQLPLLCYCQIFWVVITFSRSPCLFKFTTIFGTWSHCYPFVTVINLSSICRHFVVTLSSICRRFVVDLSSLCRHCRNFAAKHIPNLLYSITDLVAVLHWRCSSASAAFYITFATC